MNDFKQAHKTYNGILRTTQIDTMKWIGEVKYDLKLAGITQDYVLNRDLFQNQDS